VVALAALLTAAVLLAPRPSSVSASDVLAMLEKGELDYGHTWEPYVSEARAKGYTAIFSSADTPGLILDGLIFHRSVIELRADAVRLLLASWFRALEWWNSYPAEGNSRLLALLKGKTADVSRNGIPLLGLADNRPKIPAGQTRTTALPCLEPVV